MMPTVGSRRQFRLEQSNLIAAGVHDRTGWGTHRSPECDNQARHVSVCHTDIITAEKGTYFVRLQPIQSDMLANENSNACDQKGVSKQNCVRVGGPAAYRCETCRNGRERSGLIDRYASTFGHV